MKHLYLALSLSLVSLFVSIKADASDIEYKGLNYNVDLTNMTATLASPPYGYSYCGNIVVPESLIAKDRNIKVVGIKDGAFCYASRLISVKISNGVKEIGKYAFSNSGIVSVEIPSSVSIIPEEAFRECSNLSSVIINNGVTKIEDEAFLGCMSLTSITIPNSVKEIGGGVFSNCKELCSVSLPNTVEKCGVNIFACCYKLTNVTIPSNITIIPQTAFNGCLKLASVTIPKNVTKIEYGAFVDCGCTSLKFEDDTTACVCDDQGPFDDVPIKKLYIGREITNFGSRRGGNIKKECIQTLTLGRLLKKWSSDYYGDNVKTVNSMIMDPSQLNASFSNSVYMNATLYVPIGTKSAYEKADGWNKFFSIQEKDVSQM